MEYRNIRVGQKLRLRGELHGAYDAEVVQMVTSGRDVEEALAVLEAVASKLPADLRDDVGGDFFLAALRAAFERTVQVKLVLYPGDEPSLLWVNPIRLSPPRP